MEKLPPRLLSVMAALTLPLAPACDPEVNGIQIEISKTAFRTLESAVTIGCQVTAEDQLWKPAETVSRQTGTAGSFGTPIYSDYTEQALVIPHPGLATTACLNERVTQWPTETDCTLTLEKDHTDAWMVVSCQK